MMIKRLTCALIIAVLIGPALYAEEAKKSSAPFSFLNGAEMVTTIRPQISTLSLTDSGDTVYIGEIKNMGIGLGIQTALLYPISDGLSWGPNFDYSYNQVNDGSWYSLDVQIFGLGPMLKYDADNYSWLLFANYNLGFVTTEQEISSPSGGTRPAGSLYAGYPGFMLGASGLFRISDSIIIGPYINYGLLSIMSLKFRRLVSGSLTNAWVNIDTTYIQIGAQIFIDQLSPVY
ncbi:hypothetical protein ACFL5U_01660 [Candidatus Margulisiibacteriota bacterium]